jgi:hypothetical protein
VLVVCRLEYEPGAEVEEDIVLIAEEGAGDEILG